MVVDFKEVDKLRVNPSTTNQKAYHVLEYCKFIKKM